MHSLPVAQPLPKRGKRGLVMNGMYAANGFAPRAKMTKKPFRDPPKDPRQQTITLFAKKRKPTTSPQRSASPPPPPSPATASPPSPPATKPSGKKRCVTNPQCPERHRKSHRPGYCKHCGGAPERKACVQRENRARIGGKAVNAKRRDYAREYMRKRRAKDPDRFFHDTYQTSLIGRLRGTRPSKLVDGLRKACTMSQDMHMCMHMYMCMCMCM